MKIVISGHGRTGSILQEMINENKNMSEATAEDGDFDVIIDFSHPDNLEKIKEYALKYKKPVVIATTGYTKRQELSIEEMSKSVAVVFSPNFSPGITLMQRLISEITPLLKDSFDMEIIEKHHRNKLDAPSGTANLLLYAADPDNEYCVKHGRFGNGKREKEIGIHSLRCGSISGEHSVIFAGEDEVIEITHRAVSNRIFAAGALKAALFALEQMPGLYSMQDVLLGGGKK